MWFCGKGKKNRCNVNECDRPAMSGDSPVDDCLRDHLFCAGCGRIVQFSSQKVAELAEKIAAEHDFEPFSPEITIVGLCRDCKKSGNRCWMLLSMAQDGQRLRVEGFTGGCEVRHRLTAMGFCAGDEIEVVNRSGPMILNVKGGRLAIGLGLAHKIIVSRADKGH